MGRLICVILVTVSLEVLKLLRCAGVIPRSSLVTGGKKKNRFS